jgi:hypothetical protein
MQEECAKFIGKNERADCRAATEEQGAMTDDQEGRRRTWIAVQCGRVSSDRGKQPSASGSKKAGLEMEHLSRLHQQHVFEGKPTTTAALWHETNQPCLEASTTGGSSSTEFTVKRIGYGVHIPLTVNVYASLRHGWLNRLSSLDSIAG